MPARSLSCPESVKEEALPIMASPYLLFRRSVARSSSRYFGLDSNRVSWYSISLDSPDSVTLTRRTGWSSQCSRNSRMAAS
ncbi:hypothetical protein D3C73_1502190 [compost metagenome]